MRKLIILSIVIFIHSLSFSQENRDLNAVKGQYDALMLSGSKKEADSVRRDYMSRCPVIQMEDKDTYLFLSDLLFQNPYSNEFEYGTYAYRKMVWNRVAEKEFTGKEALLNSLLKGMSSGVSKRDEVDKRFEALSCMKKSLGREVSNLCEPKYSKGKHVMPMFDAVKVSKLELLSKKLGDDALLFRISNAKAMSEGQFDIVVRNLSAFAAIGSSAVPINYFVAAMCCVADNVKDKNTIHDALKCVEEVSIENKEEYSLVLSKFYFLTGDNVNGEKYKKISDDEEARRQANFDNYFKILDK